MVDIPIRAIHKCTGACPRFVTDITENVTRVRYISGSCDRNGSEEDTAINIAEYENHIWETDDRANILTGADEVCNFTGYKSPATNILIGANDLVIEDSDIVLWLTQPLNRTRTFPIDSAGGFTRRALVEVIVRTFIQIYQDERESLAQTGVRKYGVRSSDLDTLVIERIRYERVTKSVVVDVGL